MLQMSLKPRYLLTSEFRLFSLRISLPPLLCSFVDTRSVVYPVSANWIWRYNAIQTELCA